LKSFYPSPSKGAVKDQMSIIWAADQLGYKPAERAALRLICLYFAALGEHKTSGPSNVPVHPEEWPIRFFVT
jgi:hypothetical protein